MAERCGHIALITSTGGDGSRLQVRTCAQGRDDEKKVKPRELPVIAMTLPADTPKPPAAACARVVPTPSRHRIQRAQECRVPGAPAAPCATKKHRGSRHRYAGINRHSPRNGFNGLLRALPGDEFVLSPSPVDRWLVAPGRAMTKTSGGLGTSNGCQDHTASPSAHPSSPRGFDGACPRRSWRGQLKRRSSCALASLTKPLSTARPAKHPRAQRSRVHRIPPQRP